MNNNNNYYDVVKMKVGSAIKSRGADYAVETLTNMVQVIPEIWENEEDENNNNNQKKMISDTRRSEMDSVLSATTAVA